MVLKSVNICRIAKFGEEVQCKKTGNIWDVHYVYDDGDVVVSENFNMSTGDVTTTVLDAHCYWVVKKIKKQRR